LKGDGAGGFKPLTMLQSGICIPGNGRALVTLRGAKGGCLVAASQNKGDLRLFALKGERKAVMAQADEVTAIVSFRDGRQEKKELYYGSSFLSQSARTIMAGDNVKSIEIINAKGAHRTVTP